MSDTIDQDKVRFYRCRIGKGEMLIGIFTEDSREAGVVHLVAAAAWKAPTDAWDWEKGKRIVLGRLNARRYNGSFVAFKCAKGGVINKHSGLGESAVACQFLLFSSGAPGWAVKARKQYLINEVR